MECASSVIVFMLLVHVFNCLSFYFDSFLELQFKVDNWSCLELEIYISFPLDKVEVFEVFLKLNFIRNLSYVNFVDIAPFPFTSEFFAELKGFLLFVLALSA